MEARGEKMKKVLSVGGAAVRTTTHAWMLVRQSIDGNDNQHVRVVSKRGEIKSENARVHDEVSDKPKLQMYYIHPYADVAFI